MEARTMELREARFKRGITQYSLSKITGVHQSRISLIENGYKASEKEKRALAKGLGVKVEDVSWQNN
jgi:transcriptional regulator with XRE-family HTH domain